MNERTHLGFSSSQTVSVLPVIENVSSVFVGYCFSLGAFEYYQVLATLLLETSRVPQMDRSVRIHPDLLRSLLRYVPQDILLMGSLIGPCLSCAEFRCSELAGDNWAAEIGVDLSKT